MNHDDRAASARLRRPAACFHEIGHFLGLDQEDLERRGLD
jgi:predicted Zn-dependent protease with MMP-like domain